MAVKHTIEHILRDDDDASGQSVREWKIEVEGGSVTISGSRHRPESWIILRLADLTTFKSDLDNAVSIYHQMGESK